MNNKRNIEWVKEKLSQKADINQIINFDTIKGDYRLNSELISEILKGSCFNRIENECCPLIEGNKVELVKIDGRILWKTYNSKNEYAILTPVSIWKLFNNDDRYAYSNSKLFEAFNIISEEEVWIRDKREKYECLRLLLENEEFKVKYPKTMNYLRTNMAVFTALTKEGEKNVRGREACHNDEDVFFSASSYLSNITGVNRAEITRFLNGLTLIGLLKKLSLDEIPYVLLDNNKSYDFKRINYMTVEAITEEKLIQAELRITELKRLGIYISKFSRNDIFNAFGEFEAERVIPSNSKSIKCNSNITSRTESNELRNFINTFFSTVKDNTTDRIINSLDENTFLKILMKEPDKLLTVVGIDIKDYKIIVEVLRENTWLKEAITFFTDLGFRNIDIIKISNFFGERCIEEFRHKPYSGFTDIITFKRVDAAAKSIGYDYSSEDRIEAAILIVLKDAYSTKGAFNIKKEKMVVGVINFIEVNSGIDDGELKIDSIDDVMIITEALRKLTTDKTIKSVALRNSEYYYLPNSFKIEGELINNLQSRLDMMNNTLKNHCLMPVDNISLSVEQKEAIQNAAYENISIITGGPGTGKTYVIKRIIDYLRILNPNVRIKVAAPTGVVAKKIEALTGHEANTIHKMLGLKKEEDAGKNMIEAEYLIIDEASMISHVLAYQLFKALNDETKVIFVGDSNQLRPVKGNSFFESLNNESQGNSIDIKKVELIKTHRQRNNSLIIKNAKFINEGKSDLLIDESEEFQFIEATNSKDIMDNIIQVIEEQIKEGISLKKIQVLSPMKSGEIGVSIINETIQNYFNGDKKMYKVGKKKFRVGDRVMQNKNDYTIGVMNGEIGAVKEVHYDSIIVRFDSKEIKYTDTTIKDIELAYAITIHKSQGSEFPIVIIPIHEKFKHMLNRPLIYTAVTRAKDKVILVGDKRTFNKGVLNVDNNDYEDIFMDRLLSVQNNDKVILT